MDFNGGEIRLDAGTTKNGEGRVFPMTTDLRTLLKAQLVEHDRLKKAGHIVPQGSSVKSQRDVVATKSRSQS